MIIFRYLSRELLNAVAAITGVLLLVFLSNQFVHYLGRAALGKFSGDILWHLMLAEIPYLMGILLPLALFLAILLVFGRLYNTNEMTVLHACGLSRARLVALTLPAIGIITFIVGLLSLWITPHLLNYRDRLLAQSGTQMQLETTLPGRFQSANGGQQVFYVESLSGDRQHMHDIFMAQLSNQKNSPITTWAVVTAKSGYQMVDKKTGDRFFAAVDGERYVGTPGSKAFDMAEFKQYRQRIESYVADFRGIEETMPTLEVMQSHKNKLEMISELQWRFSAPLSVLLLALLAIPLSHIKPRQGKYASLLPAILIYIIYANLLLVTRNFIESGSIPPALGLWWIHGLLLLAIIGVWLWQIGWQAVRVFIYDR